MLRGLITALRTLTALPVPGRDAENFGAALPFFALVGGIIGAVLYAATLVLRWLPCGPWPELAAAVAVVGGILLTRGLHLDGLADWADGFGGGRDRESVLRIMKDPATGAFGAMALVSVLLLKWVAAKHLVDDGAALWLIAAGAVSRVVQVDLIVWLPYARAEGGKAGPFVRDARPEHLYSALIVAAAIMLGVFGPAGAVVLGAGGALGWVLGRWFRRRIGGVTGDLLGAASELVETFVLLGCAAAGGWLTQYAGWGWLWKWLVQ